MGVCQSYFGASTSGQGLSAPQLAACIRAAARSAAADNNRNAAASAAGGGAAVPTAVDAPATMTVECEGSSLAVTSFAPAMFRAIRALEQLGDAYFEADWVLQEGHAGLRETEGRSRAMFATSNHRCMLCKTVSEGEVNTLLAMLPAMLAHLTAHADSLLQRFVLALRIAEAGTGEVGWVVVFTDIFAKAPVLHEKWDLKGRQPKAGKFAFMPQRQLPTAAAAVAPPSAAPAGDEASKTAKKKNKWQVDGPYVAAAGGLEDAADDMSTDGITADKDRPSTKVDGDGYDRVVARRDKELTRVFWCQPADHAQLQRAIARDADFLAANGILDYSVLLGVRYADPASPLHAMRYNELFHPARTPHHRQHSGGDSGDEGPELQIPSERRTTCDGVGLAAASRFHRGVDSRGNVETYYVGIIDVLTSYTFLKKTANFWKNCLWSDATLSTIPPDSYRSRFVDFMSRCIVTAKPPRSDAAATANVTPPAPAPVPAASSATE